MSPLRLRYQTIELGALDIHVRGLRDTQEYLDEGGAAEALGISSSNWPLFGVVWDASHVLARLMADYEIAGLRILEVGCGLGLAALVLNQRGADISATDQHPEAAAFLKANVELNGGNDIPFVRADWNDEQTSLGAFDLIIGSDLLYERGHAESLSGFIDRHARPRCEVIIVDAGRGNVGRFGRRMAALGYRASKHPAESTGQTRCQTNSYRRGWPA